MRRWQCPIQNGILKAAKISEYQMPNDQKSLNDQKMYAKQLEQLFFQKYHTILQ